MMTEKTPVRPLQQMFMAVPPTYDFINRLLTLGIDQVWRRQAAGRLLQYNPATVLDICTGTGDLAIMLRRQAELASSIIALDYSQPMLLRAQEKSRRRNLKGIDFIHGDVADLPFEDESIDAVGIAFAFRNLTYKNPDRDVFLAEILRVLKPGGRFVIIETSQPAFSVMRWLYHTYMRIITARLGGLLSGHKGAYHYLAHSAIRFYKPSEMKTLLSGAGFRRVDYTLKLSGVAALWECIK